MVLVFPQKQLSMATLTGLSSFLAGAKGFSVIKDEVILSEGLGRDWRRTVWKGLK